MIAYCYDNIGVNPWRYLVAQVQAYLPNQLLVIPTFMARTVGNEVKSPEKSPYHIAEIITKICTSGSHSGADRQFYHYKYCTYMSPYCYLSWIPFYLRWSRRHFKVFRSLPTCNSLRALESHSTDGMAIYSWVAPANHPGLMHPGSGPWMMHSILCLTITWLFFVAISRWDRSHVSMIPTSGASYSKQCRYFTSLALLPIKFPNPNISYCTTCSIQIRGHNL